MKVDLYLKYRFLTKKRYYCMFKNKMPWFKRQNMLMVTAGRKNSEYDQNRTDCWKGSYRFRNTTSGGVDEEEETNFAVILSVKKSSHVGEYSGDDVDKGRLRRTSLAKQWFVDGLPDTSGLSIIVVHIIHSATWLIICMPRWQIRSVSLRMQLTLNRLYCGIAMPHAVYCWTRKAVPKSQSSYSCCCCCCCELLSVL